jgi:hypothetical protein
MDNSITLKLIVDGKEANETLRITKQELEELIAKGKGIDNGIGNAYQNITNELQKYNAVTIESVQKVTQWLGTQNVSSEAIEQVIMTLRKQSETLNINSSEWLENQNKIALLTNAYDSLIAKNLNSNNVTRQTIAGTSQMTNAIGALGWTLGDASTFLVNFRMGMMSIANNIPMIVQGFMQAKAAAEAAGTSIKTALVASLAGPGGLMLAINGLMFALQLLPNLFGETTKSIREQKDEVDKLKVAYERLTREQLLNIIADLNKQAMPYEQKINEAKWSMRVTSTNKDSDFLSKEDAKKYEYIIQQKKIAEETLFLLGDIDNIQNRLSINQQKLNDLNEQNYKKLVTNATSLHNAYDLVKRWIEDDEKLLKKMSGKKDQKENDQLFQKIEDELKIRQQHAENLLKIEGGSDIQLYALREEHLNEMIALYKKYGKDAQTLQLEYIENRRQLEIGMTPTLEELGVEKPNKQLEELPDDYLDKIKQQQEEELTLKEFVINNIENVFDRERALNDYRRDQQLEQYKDYANFEQIKTEITKEHSRVRTQIAQAEAEATLNTFSNVFSTLSGIFGKQTFAYKMFATFKIMADTIQATMSAYKSALDVPFIGSVLAPIAAASAAAFGASQLAKINSLEVPAYAKGGVIVGENGMEIIAPAKDYAQGQALIALETGKAIIEGLKAGYMSNNVNSNLEALFERQFNLMNEWQSKFEFVQKGDDLVSTVQKAQLKKKNESY